MSNPFLTAAALDRYVYKPLSEVNDEVRVLDLLPGGLNSDVTIHLRTIHKFIEASAPLDYHALSYTWGELENTALIIVEDGDGQWSLEVTGNCYEALQSLRLEDRLCTLWIDAICINQDDNDERSRQVELMAAIYSKSLRTTAWVGPASSDSDKAISFIRMVMQHVALRPGTDEIYPLTDQTHWVNSGFANITEEQTDALANFFSRAWFGRLWVWQEVTFSGERTTLRCGMDEISWSGLCAVIWALVRKNFATFPSSMRLISQLSYLGGRIHPNQEALLTVLNTMRLCNCTDQRDRIYTAQQLNESTGKPALEPGIQPNYLLPTKDVYTDFVIRYAEVLRDLQFLEFKLGTIMNNDSSIDSLPSWVTDWSQRNASYKLRKGRASVGCSSLIPNRRTLEVRGVIASKIEKCAKYTFNASSETNDRQRADGLRQCILELLGCDPSERVLDELYPVLAGNMFAESQVPCDGDYSSMINCRSLLRELFNLSDHHLKEERRFKAIQTLTAWCFGRSLFIDEAGKFGLAPGDAQPGDFVAVVLGTGWPVTLRPLPEDRYEFIGCAYCDGIMDAEPILGPLPSMFRSVQLRCRDGVYRPGFQNIFTQETQFRDPRLPDLSTDWEDGSAFEDFPYPSYWNKRTGEYRTHFDDPYLDVEELEKRGILLQTFILV